MNTKLKAEQDGRSKRYPKVTQKQLEIVLKQVRGEITFTEMCHNLGIPAVGSRGGTFQAHALTQYVQTVWKRNIKQL